MCHENGFYGFSSSSVSVVIAVEDSGMCEASVADSFFLSTTTIKSSINVDFHTALIGRMIKEEM